jgi:uncharacterized membrane protein YczE
MTAVRQLPWGRLGRLAAGTIAMGIGIGLMLWSHLGMVPLDVLHFSVSRVFGWTFGGGVIAVQAVLLLISLLLRLAPGIGTVLGFVLPAVTADIVLAALPATGTFAVRLAALPAGGLLFCAGVAIYLGADLGRLPRDGIMLVISGDRAGTGSSPRRLALVRIGLDVVFVVIGVLLLGPSAAVASGALGVGTLALTLGSGPLIAQALRLQNRWLARGRHRQVRESSLRRHVQVLAYDSFRHAQGNQALQVHFIQAYVRRLCELGVPFDPTAGVALKQHVQRLRLPHGHIDVPDVAQVRAQFAFWSALLWDIVLAVYTDAPSRLPDRHRLDLLAAQVGGTPAMSSFTDEEMTALAAALAVYRDPATSTVNWTDVVEQQFVPALVRVELGFQGHGTRYPQRPRTDDGDPHEARLLGHCTRALRGHDRGTPDVVAAIYRVVCGRLDQLNSDDAALDPAAATYRELIAAYNRNHPGDDDVDALHVPATVFTGAATTAPDHRDTAAGVTR